MVVRGVPKRLAEDAWWMDDDVIGLHRSAGANGATARRVCAVVWPRRRDGDDLDCG